MVKGLVRTGVSVGFAYGVYSFARKFWGKEIDAAIEAAVNKSKEVGSNLAKKAPELKASMQEIKSTAQHVGGDLAKKTPELKASMQDLSHKAM